MVQKCQKKVIRKRFKDGVLNWNSNLIARHAQLHFSFREIALLSYCFDDDYNHIVDVLAGEHSKLRLKRGFDNAIEDNHKTKSINAIVQDPIIVRSKGCGGTIQSTSGRSKRIIKCWRWGEYGRNKRSCTDVTHNPQSLEDTGLSDCNGDMVSVLLYIIVVTWMFTAWIDIISLFYLDLFRRWIPRLGCQIFQLYRTI